MVRTRHGLLLSTCSTASSCNIVCIIKHILTLQVLIWHQPRPALPVAKIRALYIKSRAYRLTEHVHHSPRRILQLHRGCCVGHLLSILFVLQSSEHCQPFKVCHQTFLLAQLRQSHRHQDAHVRNGDNNATATWNQNKLGTKTTSFFFISERPAFPNSASSALPFRVFQSIAQL